MVVYDKAAADRAAAEKLTVHKTANTSAEEKVAIVIEAASQAETTVDTEPDTCFMAGHLTHIRSFFAGHHLVAWLWLRTSRE